MYVYIYIYIYIYVYIYIYIYYIYIYTYISQALSEGRKITIVLFEVSLAEDVDPRQNNIYVGYINRILQQ